MRRLEGVIDRYEGNLRMTGQCTSKDAVQKLLAEELGKKERKAAPRGDTFWLIFCRYAAEVESGEILNQGKLYSEASRKLLGLSAKKLQGTELGAIKAAEIREDHLRRFVADLTSAGYAKNTVATYMDGIMSALNGSRRLGWHNGAILDAKAFQASQEEVEHHVYLAADEQKAIAALTLSGKQDQWRDVFLLGCQLGMRFSDLRLLTSAHRKADLVNINTKKTGTVVYVPLNSQAKNLWDRMDGKLTLPHYSTFNDFIKELGHKAAETEAGKAAGLDRTILFSRTEGGQKVQRWVKKADMLSTHTMRRSFATNAFKAGVPVPSIMKVTGHKSLASFMKYIRLTDEEHAQQLLAHPHFK